MNKVVQYIRNDTCINGYPSISDQIKTTNQYSQVHDMHIEKTFIDQEPFSQASIYEAIRFCDENEIKNIVMYSYKTLSHKSIDRVSISKSLYNHGIKILFCQ